MSRSARGRRSLLVGSLVIAGLMAGAPRAAAIPGCALSSSTLTVTVSGSNEEDVVLVSVVDNGVAPDRIRVGELFEGSSDISCSGGVPTVANVNTISAVEGTPGRNSKLQIQHPLEFAPGATAEADSSEIEFTVDLSTGTFDSLQIDNGDGNDHLAFGSLGVNFNANVDPAASADADLTLASIDDLFVDGSLGNDVLGGAGGFGTGATFPAAPRLRLRGGAGDDILTGGLASFDEVSGEGDNDVLDGGPGGDDIDGGDGIDTVSYATASGPITLDLSISGFQETGGSGLDTIKDGLGDPDSIPDTENAIGSGFADVLRGNEAANELRGGGGGDRLVGLPGADVLLGELGRDRLKARDGVADAELNCGKGRNAAESARVDRIDPKPKSC